MIGGYALLLLFFSSHISHCIGWMCLSLCFSRTLLTPWTAACQAPLSSTVFWSLLRFMFIESMMLSNHLILCHSLLLLPSIFPSIRLFYYKSTPHVRSQSIGASASASVFPINTRWLKLHYLCTPFIKFHISYMTDHDSTITYMSMTQSNLGVLSVIVT